MKRYRVEWEAGDLVGVMILGAVCASHIVDKLELLGRQVRRITLIDDRR